MGNWRGVKMLFIYLFSFIIIRSSMVSFLELGAEIHEAKMQEQQTAKSKGQVENSDWSNV